MTEQLARAVGALIGQRGDPTNRKRGDGAQQFSELLCGAGVELAVSAAGQPREFAKDLLDFLRRIPASEFTALIENITSPSPSWNMNIGTPKSAAAS